MKNGDHALAIEDSDLQTLERFKNDNEGLFKQLGMRNVHRMYDEN